MKLNVPCKINLGLYVLSRRADGYHNIESVLFPIPFYDELIVEEAGAFGFKSSGITIEGNVSDNLCVKAFDMVKSVYDIPPVDIRLYKNIPTGAGLGGGSADAAFTLKALNALFGIGLGQQQLMDMAAGLGSDCPFFVDGRPALATGRGEVLTPLDLALDGYWLLLVKPPFGVPTREAYAGVMPCDGRRSLRDLPASPVNEWSQWLVNDFEASVFMQYPEVGRIKQMLTERGAVFASMSGSGSAVFGLFEHEPETGDFPSEYFTFCRQL